MIAGAVTWRRLDAQLRVFTRTTSITPRVSRYGTESLASGRQRNWIFTALERLISDKIEHQIVAFDTAAAVLIAQRQRPGQIGELQDTMLAGTVIVNPCKAHVIDWTGPLVDPWIALTSK